MALPKGYPDRLSDKELEQSLRNQFADLETDAYSRNLNTPYDTPSCWPVCKSSPSGSYAKPRGSHSPSRRSPFSSHFPRCWSARLAPSRMRRRRSIGDAWYRILRGIGSEKDYDKIERLSDSEARELLHEAADAPDAQRDRLFGEFLNEVGGLDQANQLVMEHMALHGFDLDEEQAYDLLDRWRKYGIVRDESLGDWLDGAAANTSE